jgi:small subunit ribosomal protein S9
MTEEPQQPEGEAPEDEAQQGAPGEPGEATPSEIAPDAEETGPAADESAPEAEEAPADSEAPGPEIEGLEELGQATAEGGEEEAQPEGEAPSGEEAAAEEGEAPAGEEAAAVEGEAPSGEEAPAEEAAAEERPAQRQRQRRGGGGDQEEVIPGAHLEPDLVLEEQRAEGEYGEYDQYAEEGGPYEEGEGEEAPEPAPVAHTPLELAADARYNATGKRKSAIARVILKPGEGSYTINGRHLDEYFPRVRLQRMASQPLEAAGYHTRMDVVARIHGGGVSAQANALRHGVARALVEADPALRAEMKSRGYLTRDPREKERKKAGLKKARKRPQFSKR